MYRNDEFAAQHRVQVLEREVVAWTNAFHRVSEELDSRTASSSIPPHCRQQEPYAFARVVYTLVIMLVAGTLMFGVAMAMGDR